MKYREFETVADWGCQRHPPLDATQNVFALRRLSSEHRKEDRQGAKPGDASISPATAQSGNAPATAPDHHWSWLEKLATDFDIAGQALAFGSIAELEAPRLETPRANSGRTLRKRWSWRLGAAITARYHGFMREMAIRRAVQDLHRLDAATLRDVGIHDRMMIEIFVRNGCDS